MDLNDRETVEQGVAGGCLGCLVFISSFLISYTPMLTKGGGVCCWLIIFMPLMVVSFFGGMMLNGAFYAMLTMVVCGYPFGICCMFPVFFCFGIMTGLSISLGSPMIKYEEMSALPDMRGVGICDRGWYDYKGGVYFRDGVLTRDGQLPQNGTVHVPHCGWRSGDKHHAGYWASCTFGIRPIFECDSSRNFFDDCSATTPCAWAITKDGSNPALPASCRGTACGFWADIVTLNPLCYGPSTNAYFHGTMKDLCWQADEELADGIQAVASRLGLAYDASTPFLELGDPEQVKEELFSSVKLWWALLFTYNIPFFAALCFGCFFGGTSMLKGREATDAAPYLQIT
eukprot:TRINITY_DN50727_c0_g1_i1.p1 TRINITY_DN50727_c0_g1~~TRINITY_DN50727_c0_g1_i1.p1  ORF type:complete len:343 (-),score=21.97 TRINITY_DN50727_c0_g1_i1:167-1195(-)